MDELLAAFVTCMADILIFEAYLSLMLILPQPVSSLGKALISVPFFLTAGLLLLSLKIPLSAIEGTGTQVERLLAVLPVVVASFYLLLFRRQKVREVRRRFP
jgi:hypothetical protein